MEPSLTPLAGKHKTETSPIAVDATVAHVCTTCVCVLKRVECLLRNNVEVEVEVEVKVWLCTISSVHVSGRLCKVVEVTWRSEAKSDRSGERSSLIMGLFKLI